jgi:predicted acetyltransferase
MRSDGLQTLELVRPAQQHLASYVAALQQGWSADNVRGAVAAHEELQRIAEDADGFLATMHDPEAKGPAVTLPDGSKVARIPGFRLWMWDGSFVGSTNLRWLPGGAELPAHVLGHIGCAVVPWKQNLGHGTRALALLAGQRQEQGLPHVDLTTDSDNLASQRVIENNGGVLLMDFIKPAVYGGKPGRLYRIPLG